jgi:hypothetical protein
MSAKGQLQYTTTIRVFLASTLINVIGLLGFWHLLNWTLNLAEL